MVDIAVMGINMGAVLEDFENADFAYAPPFSTAIHPFVQAVYVLMNKLDGKLVSMTPAEYAAGAAEGYKVVDVAPEPTIRGAHFVNLAQVNGEIEGLGKDEKLLLVCARGKRGYFLQNRMRYYGYKKYSRAGRSDILQRCEGKKYRSSGLQGRRDESEGARIPEGQEDAGQI